MAAIGSAWTAGASYRYTAEGDPERLPTAVNDATGRFVVSSPVGRGLPRDLVERIPDGRVSSGRHALGAA